MPLSIFCDALPYNEIKENYSDFLPEMQTAELVPNIAYSSSLHWQLYCDKYPDDRGVLVDWVKEPEKNKLVCFISSLLSPLDYLGDIGLISRKVLDKFIFRSNTFANIPYRFRKHFSQQSKYLFWSKETYGAEDIFSGYEVVSQDEGHLSFESTINKLNSAISSGQKNIFAVFGFADALGHKCRRGDEYSRRLKAYMDELQKSIIQYQKLNPEESVLIVSDHGMSTVEKKIDFELEKRFGKQSLKQYIAYCDTAIMCVWTADAELKKSISSYLKSRTEGHLLSEEERAYYRATDRKFGDIIYILREGFSFGDNWFGKSIRKPTPDGSGAHGIWPEREAKDQMACILLSGGTQKLQEVYDYPGAYALIKEIMK